MEFGKIFLILGMTLLALVASTKAQDCPDLGEDTALQVYDCSGTAAFCVPLELEDLLTGDLEVLVDGTPYTEGFESCGEDSILVYSYFTLLGNGNAGPYEVTTWEIDGVNYQGEFANISDLVDSMNVWDPTGNWTLDAQSLNIIGGDISQDYSDMVIEQLQFPGTFANLIKNFDPIPLGVNVPLTEGTHVIEVNNTVLGCSDTVNVNVICTPNHYVEDTIYLGLSGQYCGTHPALPGNPGVPSSCTTSMSSSVDFYVDSENCISFFGAAPGVSEACYVVCDDLGFCDTTFLSVEVIFPPEDGVVVATISQGEIATECFSAENLSGNPADFTLLNECPENGGNDVDFSFENGSLCVEYEGLSVGVDTACMVYCDAQGNCDSTTLYISVVDNPIVAQPDTATGMEGDAILIDVLANDNVVGNPIIEVLSTPNHGVANVTNDDRISYNPNSDFCGTDSFDYRVCNQQASSCDTVEVTIQVTCNDIKVYNGFSPNDDGKNDTFEIAGIESYPNCSVKIFNAWGSMVYDNDGAGYNDDNRWDGTWDGKNLPDGNYFYVIDLNDGTDRRYSGYLLLFR